jgi:hypothetical protein
MLQDKAAVHEVLDILICVAYGNKLHLDSVQICANPSDADNHNSNNSGPM